MNITVSLFSLMTTGLLLLAGAILYVAWQTAHPGRSTFIESGIDGVHSIDDLPWNAEKRTFEGHGNTQIDGVIVSAGAISQAPCWNTGESSKTFILIHGHKKNKNQMLGRGQVLLKMGYNLVLIDFRHHGNSEDGPFGLGYFGRYDLKNIIETIKESIFPGTKVGVFGVSLGATTALATFGEWHNIDCIICDSPSSNQTRTLCEYAQRLYRAPYTITSAALNIAERYYGMDFSRLDICSLINVNPFSWLHLPLLILHGDSDNRVPHSHSENIINAIKSKKSTHELSIEIPQQRHTFTLFKSANHVQAYSMYREEYDKSVREFLLSNFPVR